MSVGWKAADQAPFYGDDNLEECGYYELDTGEIYERDQTQYEVVAAVIIKDRYKKIDGFKKITTKLNFDLLNEVEEFDVVRHVFPVGRKSELVLPTKITRMQVQLCVRNQDCITDIEEVDLNGR